MNDHEQGKELAAETLASLSSSIVLSELQSNLERIADLIDSELFPRLLRAKAQQLGEERQIGDTPAGISARALSQMAVGRTEQNLRSIREILEQVVDMDRI